MWTWHDYPIGQVSPGCWFDIWLHAESFHSITKSVLVSRSNKKWSKVPSGCNIMLFYWKLRLFYYQRAYTLGSTRIYSRDWLQILLTYNRRLDWQLLNITYSLQTPCCKTIYLYIACYFMPFISLFSVPFNELVNVGWNKWILPINYQRNSNASSKSQLMRKMSRIWNGVVTYIHVTTQRVVA